MSQAIAQLQYTSPTQAPDITARAAGTLARAKYPFRLKRQGLATGHAARASHHNDQGVQMLIIDRFEGDFAVIETSGGMVNIPVADIPANCKEGDVLTLALNSSASKQRKKRIDGLMNDLFSD